ncbi:N-acetylmuramoyl-L-alanine amidase [Bacillus swezeyi]|uniref:N-acetylmuramoyl-L-alanine amidase n=1 Tax=Bacillus swezeyi TaxID=1925020 RepID=UPI0039C72029
MSIIVIDAGHGGKDGGATGNGLIEKNLALEMVLNVEEQLKTRKGVKVHLTRKSDVFVPLNERASKANELNSNLFVSFHHNAGGGTGFESYIYPGLKNTLTEKIQQVMHKKVMSFMKLYNIPDRGQKEADFVVLKKTKMPAILLENLFLDSIQDAALLKDSIFKKKLSKTIADCIADIASKL